MSDELQFRSLRKRFGRRVVLDDVELALEPATLTLLSGPNGTGKSTLLKILAGIERPDHGGLVCAGTTLRWQRARARLRRRLIYLHQQPYLFDRSILGNLLYGLGGPRGCGRQHALAMLEELGLGYLAERPDSAGLSGGERQRLALARALLREPDFLLLDEPTASLDPQAREQCFGLIAALRKRGIGLVVASHDLVPLATLADHHWHLQDGRLRRGDPPAADRAGDAEHRVLPFPTVIAGGKS